MLKIMLAQSTKSTNDRARNIKMPFPPKSLPKNARAPRASKIPPTTRGVQTLTAKVADDDDYLDNGDEDETLTELQKEYESEDSIGKNTQSPHRV